MAKEEDRRAGSLPAPPTGGELRSAAARADSEEAARPECAIPVANSLTCGIGAKTRVEIRRHACQRNPARGTGTPLGDALH